MKKLSHVPLHISILTIFVVLIVALLGVVVTYNQKKNADVAISAADRLLDEISRSVFERVTRIFEPAFAVADQTVLLPGIGNLPDTHGHPLAPIIINALDANPSILSLYMGFANGDFFIVSRFPDDDDFARTNQGAPVTAQYNVQRITTRPDGVRVRVLKFLGPDLHVVGSKVVKHDTYDPRKRPWYKLAIGMDRTMLTDLYVYTWSREVGLTAARRFDGDVEGVFGVDIALAETSRFLAKQVVGSDGRILMFNRSGTLLAYSRTDRVVREVVVGGKPTVQAARLTDLDEPAMDALYAAFEESAGEGFSRRMIEVDGRRYLARVEAMPERLGKEQYLGMLVPLSEFTGPIEQAGRESLIVSLVTLLIFVPAIVYSSRRLSSPLRALSGEAAKIERFDLEGEVEVRTNITEIRDLTRAMATMKSTLGSFAHYVPKALVERMVRLRIVPRLGGERRELTLFFTDIRDFTTISEGMPAEELTHLISRYFMRIGSVVLGEGGTIDKFIGDAVMAFWNAPEPVDDHARRACLAALRCRSQSHEFNEILRSQDEPPLHTRFGLHTGDAIVGNIGSSDRMDYTAMGRSVNIASRLEGLNKYFGTEILVSEPTVVQAGADFLFRQVGRVLPKGVTTPVAVYELRGVVGALADANPELAVDLDDVDYCRRWNRAFDSYHERNFNEAAALLEELGAQTGADPVAAQLLERARVYAATPPGAEWNGVEIINGK